MGKGTMIAAVAAVVVACISGVQAEVVIDTVPVGNPGNAGELSGAGAGGWGPDRICGAVDYVYRIGTFEVTAGQYKEFLNAVAATDTYGLYNTGMLSSNRGCKIRQTGSPGGYAYLVDADGDDLEDTDWVDRPVNYVSWGDAARFSNWLHNGQPTGAQDLSTTEDGSYLLDGALSDAELSAVTREPDAGWVIPSEDEWYKAAFHYNDGVTGNYWDYPTESNTVPTPEAPSGTDLTNGSANYYGDDYAIGSPYYRTEVGAYDAKPSDSPYATFDQAGNVREWNEIVLGPSWRGLRGGAFNTYGISYLHAARRFGWNPTYENYNIGFRVADVSEQAPCADDDGDGRVAICHIPAGNPDIAHTISVSENALPAHLAHGDSCGPCEEDDDLLLRAGESEVCSPDVNGDGAVGPFDLAILLGAWGPCEGCATDFNGDGVVDAFDLAQVLGAWGMCP